MIVVGGIAKDMASRVGESTVVVETPVTKPWAQPSLPAAPFLFCVRSYFPFLACRAAPLYFAPMQRSQLVLSALATSFLLIGSRGPALAQSTSTADPSPPRAALVGNWIMDQEATADAIALDQFGPKRWVVPNPEKPGQPQTFSTNFTDKPFSWQEYAMTRSTLLAGLRANTNEVTSRMTFAADGTGMNSDLNKSGVAEPVEHFQWVLQGNKLTITSPGKKTSIETEFTNRNQLSLALGRGMRIVLKPETSATHTNAPAP